MRSLNTRLHLSQVFGPRQPHRTRVIELDPLVNRGIAVIERTRITANSRPPGLPATGDVADRRPQLSHRKWAEKCGDAAFTASAIPCLALVENVHSLRAPSSGCLLRKTDSSSTVLATRIGEPELHRVERRDIHDRLHDTRPLLSLQPGTDEHRPFTRNRSFPGGLLVSPGQYPSQQLRRSDLRVDEVPS